MPGEIILDDIPVKMKLVYNLASKSNDTSTQNGAIICRCGWNIATGYNHVINGFIDDPESYKRPRKYSVTEHAERAVLFDSVARGANVRRATMVANWVACPDCARAIVLCGIGDVVCHKECMDRTPERWRKMVDLGLEIMQKNGVQVHYWSGVVGVENLNNGEVWLA